MRTFLLSLFCIGGLMSTPVFASEKAIFAGGCFWCMQPAFDNTEGVEKSVVGYTGGEKANPTYEEVSSGRSGHFEAIEVTYDPKKVEYSTLVTTFLENIDPFDAEGQFADKGSQYHTAIFYNNEAQKTAAQAGLKKVEAEFPGKKIAVQLLPAKPFYAAEEYHQDYYQKNSVRYNMYKYGSGRAGKLKEIWGDKEHQ